MNMAVKIQRGDTSRDRARHGPQTVIGRLREYARVRHEHQVNPFQDSPMARIVEMKENAGIRGSGIRYDIIRTEDDPVGTPCPPDGGLGELCDRAGEALTRQARCQEVATAIHQMPAAYREVIEAMFHVSQREEPRPYAEAAMRCGKPKGSYQLILNAALGWLEGRLCLPVDRFNHNM